MKQDTGNIYIENEVIFHDWSLQQNDKNLSSIVSMGHVAV